jgi:protein gp37
MSDLFHEGLAEADIAKVFDVIRQSYNRRLGHVFQILTKRPERMADLMPRLRFDTSGLKGTYFAVSPDSGGYPLASGHKGATGLPSVWLGTSVEDQATADERIPLLRKCPAAVRFVSYEPALAGVDFSGLLDGIHWLILGGESGHGARPCKVGWIRSAMRQAKARGVSVFVKQLGARPLAFVADDGGDFRVGGMTELSMRSRKGGDMSEWPEDLRVREFPVTTERGVGG